jgi:hypothetical protein
MAEIAITQEPLSQIVPSGQTGTFTVAVKGDGTITYQWLTTAHRIALLSGFNPVPGQEVDGFWPITGAVAASYTTPPVLPVDNGGQFVCYIKNAESIPQSVGNLNFFGVYGPQTTPQSLFSQVITQPAVLTVQ